MKGNFIKRKTIVINKPLQYSLVAGFLFSVLLALLIFSMLFILYYWAASSVGDNMFKEYIIIHKQVEKTYEVEKEDKTIQEKYFVSEPSLPVRRWEIIAPPLLINNLIIMVIVVAFGITYSHRLAGPVYRMNADIIKVLSGEKGLQVKIRDKDKFRDLADNINKLIAEFDKMRN